MSQLKPLALQYGINQVSVAGFDVTLVKASVPSEASHIDGYAAFLSNSSGLSWLTIEGKAFVEAHLHTYEDSLSNVRFFKDADNLYVLYGKRDLVEGYAPSIAGFTLFSLQPDDTGIPAFKAVGTHRTSLPYCNIDWAFHREFRLPLRIGNNETAC